MNILHVIPGLQNSSGPTQVVLNLAAQTVTFGHQVSIAYISNRKLPVDLSVFDPRIDIKGFSARWFRHWAFSPAFWSFLRRYVSEYDIIHLHSLWLFPNIAVWFWAKRRKIPYIIKPAGSLQPWAFRLKNHKKIWYLKLFERQNIEGAAFVHATSENELVNIGNFNFSTPVYVIPNGISTTEHDIEHTSAEARKELGIPADAFVILFLSRIHPVKNIEFLLEVVAEVIIVHPEVLLVIAGPDDTVYARSIKQEVVYLGLENYCCFLGEVTGKRKILCFRASNVFVLPSLSENFAIVIVEAMAAGLPVVVSKETPWELVEERRAGFWLPLCKSDFVDCLMALIENDDLRYNMGQQAMKLAKHFDWVVITKQMLVLYTEIIANVNSSK